MATTEQDGQQKQDKPLMFERHEHRHYELTREYDEEEDKKTAAESKIAAATRIIAGVAASSLNYTETAPTVSAERPEEIENEQGMEEINGMSPFNEEKGANGDNEIAASIQLMKQAQTDKVVQRARDEEAASSQEPTRPEEAPMKTEPDDQLDPQQWGPRTEEVLHHIGRGQFSPHATTRANGLIEAENKPKTGTENRQKDSPIKQERRGRLQNIEYVRRTGEEREDSNGRKETDADGNCLHPEDKVREGRKRLHRTEEAIEEIEACQRDHYNVTENWRVGGNNYGYFCICRYCNCQVNDLVYWGPRSKITGENRFHCAELEEGDDLENYPQDKICCICNKTECYPLICEEWHVYNTSGLSKCHRLQIPPLPIGRSLSKAGINANAATTSARTEGSMIRDNNSQTGSKRKEQSAAKRSRSPGQYSAAGSAFSEAPTFMRAPDSEGEIETPVKNSETRTGPKRYAMSETGASARSASHTSSRAFESTEAEKWNNTNSAALHDQINQLKTEAVTSGLETQKLVFEVRSEKARVENDIEKMKKKQ